MKTMRDTGQRLVFLGPQKGLFKGPLPPRVSVCHDSSEVEAAVNSPTRHVTWISFTRNFTDILLQKAVDIRPDLRGSHLITLMPPRAESIPALLGLFHPVFGLVEGFQWLPKHELVEVVTRDDASWGRSLIRQRFRSFGVQRSGVLFPGASTRPFSSLSCSRQHDRLKGGASVLCLVPSAAMR
jgi:hypothetical protein